MKRDLEDLKKGSSIEFAIQDDSLSHLGEIAECLPSNLRLRDFTINTETPLSESQLQTVLIALKNLSLEYLTLASQTFSDVFVFRIKFYFYILSPLSSLTKCVYLDWLINLNLQADFLPLQLNLHRHRVR